MLDFFPNADHTPIYAAQAGGHFSELGLDVQVRAPSDPAAPLRQAAAGRVDLAVSYTPEVMRARDKGVDVVAVGALVQRPLTSIISLPRREDREPEGPARQGGRHRRHRLPVGVPPGDPRAGGRRPRRA